MSTKSGGGVKGGGAASVKPQEQISWSEEIDMENPIGGDKASELETKQPSWAQKLGSNLPSHWDKNVLEVVFQKEGLGAFVVSDEECAKLIKKLGLDPRPGPVESVQFAQITVEIS